MQLPTRPTSNKYIIGVNSPYYISANSDYGGWGYTGNGWTTAKVYIDIWSGGLTASYHLHGDGGDHTLQPSQVLTKDKISSTDTEVIFELSDYIRPYISPVYTAYDYTTGTGIIASSEAVWFQVKFELYDYGPTSSTTSPVYTWYTSLAELGGGNTMVANLGWKWNDQVNDYYTPDTSAFGGSQSFIDLYNYDDQMRYFFNYTNLLAYNSNDLIVRSSYLPIKTVCAKQPLMIVYINKDGWWDYFTPIGRVITSAKMSREKYSFNLRNPMNYNSSQNHMTKTFNQSDIRTWSINTGILPEKLGAKVEEILLSPKVYLLEFTGTTVNGYYDGYRQIPVIVTNTDFVRKTRLNDKGKTSYTIILDETTSKIDNIR